MIAFIASLLGFGGVAAQTGSTYGPSDCPLGCRRSAIAQGTDVSRGRRYVRKEATMSLLRGDVVGNAGNVRTSRSWPS